MRSHRLHALLAVMVACALLLAASSPALAREAARTSSCENADTRPGNGTEADLSKATVCLVNRERTRRGMRVLRMNRRLSRAALAHSLDMTQEGYFQHVSRAGQDVVDRLNLTGYLGRVRNWLVGENLAWGTGSRSTPRETVVGWMNSPPHRRNILNRRFREIGMGVVFHAPTSNAPVAATYTSTFGSRR